MDPTIESLPYVDFQHDAIAVFDDVEQGVVLREDIWVSAYKSGSESVHGKARVQVKEGGGVELTSRNGIELKRVTKTNFTVSVSSLGIVDLPVRFPKQVIHPQYTKEKPTSAPLHINCISHSPKAGQLLIGGQDGYCIIIPTSTSTQSPISHTSPTSTKPLILTGHVGDVLSALWFPSGQVVLTSSSDLSIRIFSSMDAINPRTLLGHTRAITSLSIVGVGREVISGSKDGSVRVWEVGSAKEVKKWVVDERKAVDGLVIVHDEKGKKALQLENEDRVVLAASPDGTITGWPYSAASLTSPLFRMMNPTPMCSNLVSVAYSPDTQLIATGHANGIVAIRHLASFRTQVKPLIATAPDDFQPDTSVTTSEGKLPIKLVRRNESSIYSLNFIPYNSPTPSSDSELVDLLVGTASGLPCRLRIEIRRGGVQGDRQEIGVRVMEEYAGWEATGVESWTVGPDGVWCAGGEGGIRRY